MELTLRTIFWAVQILGFLMPPLLLFVLAGAKESRRRCAAMLAALLLIAELGAAVTMTLHPPIVDSSASSKLLTARDKDTIRAVASGIYSTNIPIFPWMVVVTEHTDSVLRWRTHYAFWGMTEHVFGETYECTKPLTGW